MAVRRALLAVIAGMGCLGAPEPYRCDLRGGDRACDSVAGAVCLEGSCAEPVSNDLCASGFRFTASAATPGACASPRATLADATLDTTAVDTTAVDTAAVDTAAVDTAAVDTAAVDVVDASRPVDVADVAGPTDAPDLDARDVTAQRDVSDDATIDAPDVRDAGEVRDVPVVLPPICAINGRIVAPLPSERLLGRRVDVHAEGVGPDATAWLSTGITCEAAPTSARLASGVGTFIDLPRGYVCVALQATAPDGQTCRTPWRRVAMMAGDFGRLVSPRLGFWPDFDNDGWADLLVATSEGPRVVSMLATGGVSVRSAPRSPTANAVPDAMAAVGDLDGDGYGDAVVLWSDGGPRALYVHRGGADGLTRAPLLLPLSVISASDRDRRQIYALGDRDGDGRTEVAMVVSNPRALLVWSASAPGLPTAVGAINVQGNIVQVAAGADLTGDRRPDIAIAHSGQVEVFPGGGGASLTLSPSRMQSAFGDVMVSGSDTNGDGVSELIVRDSVSNSLQAYRYLMGGWVRDLQSAGSATDAAIVLAAGDMETVAPDDLVVLDASNVVRVRRGGFDSDLTAAVPWSPQAGVLLAGTSEAGVVSRAWFPRSANNGRHGIALVGLNGNAIDTQVYDSIFNTPIRLIAR